MHLREYSPSKRRPYTSLILLILMYTNHFFVGSLVKVCLNLLIWATFSAILLISKTSWTKWRLILAALAVALETGAGLVWYHEINLIYFLAVVIIAITMQLSFPKSPIPVLAAMFVAAMLYIRFGSDNVFSILSFVLFSIILYFYIRTRMQRNEMTEMDKRHLAELQEAYDQLQEASVTAMQYAVLEERTRIARDIHDAVGHSLTSLIVQMQALKYMMKKDPEDAQNSLEEMLTVARTGLQDIRTSVHALADNQSKSGIIPLKALLSRMEADAAILYKFYSELNDEEINVTISGILFRVLQEAITNIIRHSQATFVDVSLKKESGNIVMTIRDSGILDSNQKVSEGFGLKMMKSRLEEMGGNLHYMIVEPHGFEITAVIPNN